MIVFRDYDVTFSLSKSLKATTLVLIIITVSQKVFIATQISLAG